MGLAIEKPAFWTECTTRKEKVGTRVCASFWFWKKGNDVSLVASLAKKQGQLVATQLL